MSHRHPYATEQYALTLTHAGEAMDVPEWGCQLLLRAIPGHTELRDAVGCYPLTIFGPDSDLNGGLKRLRDAGCISVVVVADPIRRPSQVALEASFDFARPFKRHFMFRADLGQVMYSKHHRYEVKQALKNVAVRPISLADHLEEWSSFYSNLRERHGITGVQAFGQESFKQLATLAGLRTIGAFADDTLVSAHIWIEHEGEVWSHLAASSTDGYRLRASYGIYDSTLKHFCSSKLINFGGGAGSTDDASDSLAKFKSGFSNDSRCSVLCGKVLDQKAYAEIASGFPATAFFPAYRAPK